VFWPEVESGAFQKYVLEPGDVCIAMDRPFTRDRVLRCGLIQNADLPALLVQRVTRLRACLNRVMPEFLIFVVQSQSMAERLTGRQTPGGYAPHISGRDISEFTFALPPLSVQERIVEVIGAVDDQITALDAEADALKGVYLAATSMLWLTSQGNEAKSRPLGEVMHLDVVRTPMEAGTTYHLAGVLNAGKGLVKKEAFDGADTEYTAMNVFRENQVVMRKLTAWEGPITVVPAEFDGFVASNEFPTFTLAGDIAPEWVKHVCRTPRLWAEMQSRVVGTVQRRKRLNPDQLLLVALPVPSRPEQEQIAEALDAIEGQIPVIRAEATKLRQARAGLLSRLLDRTIEIEPAELEV
jgi:type I restriction enzyme S subunit